MNRRWLMLLALFLLLFGLMLLSFLVGRYPIRPQQVLGISFSGILPIKPFWDERTALVFLNVRLPRVALAMLVGASLSAAGTSYQGVFQNPMASPDVLGASSGAALGACVAILFGLPGRLVAPCAFAGGVLAVCLAMAVSRKTGGNRATSLVLSGIMVGSLCTAGTSYIKLVADPTEQLPAITYWLMGSLAGSRISDVRLSLIPMGVGLIGLLLMSWRLNLLTLGDDEAQSLGVNARRDRALVVLLSTLLTAASVAVSGVIGWIGLVVPHLMRKLIGHEYRFLMPASMLGGALLLLVVDDLARTLWTSEIPLGILTAFVGAPFFLWLLVRKETV